MQLDLSPRSCLSGLAIIISGLLICNLAAIGIEYGMGHDVAWGFIALFTFNAEQNVPTVYAALTLLLSSLLLLAIARKHRQEGEAYLAWMMLGLVFAFLAFDEFAVIHERLNGPVRSALNVEGFLTFGWIIPYGIAVAVLALLYVPFLVRIPRRTAFLFIVAGAIFVSGAIGLEMVGGKYSSVFGFGNATYSLITTLEELLEKIGIAVFIFALVEYILQRFGPIRISVA